MRSYVDMLRGLVPSCLDSGASKEPVEHALFECEPCNSGYV